MKVTWKDCLVVVAAIAIFGLYVGVVSDGRSVVSWRAGLMILFCLLLIYGFLLWLSSSGNLRYRNSWAENYMVLTKLGRNTNLFFATLFVIVFYFAFTDLVDEAPGNFENTNRDVLKIPSSPDKYLKLVLGGTNVFNLDKAGSEKSFGNNYLPVCGGDTSALLITWLDDNLRVDSKIYDIDGKLVAEIIDNEWQVNQNTSFKMNADESGLEVVDNYGVVALQIKVEANTVQVNGMIHCDGLILGMNNRHMIQLPEPSASPNTPTYEEFKREYLRFGRNIKPIFTYVGRDYYGKRLQ